MPGTDCRAAAAAPEPEREGVYAASAVTQDRGLHQISHWLAVTSQACGEMLLANGEKTGSQAISTVSGKDRYRPTLRTQIQLYNFLKFIAKKLSKFVSATEEKHDQS